MSERLEQYYPCPGCTFHGFSQVNQCEPKGETCRWLLGMLDKVRAYDKLHSQLAGVRHWIEKCRAWSSQEHGWDTLLDELEEEMK